MANTGQYDSQTNIELEDYEREIFVQPEAAVIYGGSGVSSVNGQTGDVTLTTSDLENTSGYQTGEQVQSAIAGKQDKLTAGANITIDANNVISATGGGSSGVSDVQIDGASIVSGGVANIPFAASSSAGVIKVGTAVSTYMGSDNRLSATTRTYEDYTSGGAAMFIGKGTLENVITGKGLVTNQDISGKANKISVVQTSASTIEINPNTFYKFGEVASLNITLASITDNTIYNEYMFEFVSGTTATTLTLPSSIKWLETPTIDANKIYQCSIVDNIGILVGVKNV